VITLFESHRYDDAVSDDQLVDTEKRLCTTHPVNNATDYSFFLSLSLSTQHVSALNTRRFGDCICSLTATSIRSKYIMIQTFVSAIGKPCLYRFDVSVIVSAVDMKKEPDVSETALGEQNKTW
jgi:hypothetical protein